MPAHRCNMADTTQTQQTQQQQTAQGQQAKQQGPTEKRPSLLHYVNLSGVMFARPRRAAQGDNGAKLMAEVYIPLPLLGICFKTGIWGQPKSAEAGAKTVWVPEFSLPRKVGAIPNSDAAEESVIAFKDAILDKFEAWAKDVRSGKAQNVDALPSRAVRSVEFEL